MSSSPRELIEPRHVEAAESNSCALTDADSGVSLGPDDARAVFRLMLRTMTLAERLAILTHRCESRGGWYNETGTEMLSVVSAYCLQAHDVICPALHNMGARLTTGLAPEEILRGYFARVPGSRAGSYGSFPHVPLDNHVVAVVSQLKQVVLFIAGAVWAEKRDGRDAVGMTYVTAGSSPDDFDDAMASAVQWRIPLVLVIENGQQGELTPVRRSLADRAKAHGLACTTVDGTSVLAVYGAVRGAVSRARRGEGPGLVECMFYRSDEGWERCDGSHLPRDLMPHVQNRMLTARFEASLLDAGILALDETAAIRADEQRRVLDAVYAVYGQPGANCRNSAE